LGGQRAHAKEFLPQLVATLDDGDPDVRLCAAVALVYVNRAPEAVLPLASFLEDDEPAIRLRAVRALHILGSVAKPAVGALRSVLRDDDKSLRLEAAIVMVAIDHQMSRPAIPVLSAAMNNGNYFERRRAATAGAELGPIAIEMIPALVANLDHDDFRLRLHVAEVIMKIDPLRKKEAMAVVNDILSNAGLNRRRTVEVNEAIKAVERMGPNAVSAAPYLRTMFEKDDGHYRIAAAVAYVRALPEHSSHGLEFLVRAMQSGKRAERYYAATGLIRLGPAAKTSAPALRKLLRHKNERVRKSAARVLAKMAGARAQQPVEP